MNAVGVKETRYTFGDTITAAERLQRIADFFNPLSAEFIRSNSPRKITRAADLGCGPGFSTDMLAKATGAQEITGIDSSEYFLNICRQHYPEYKFIHDDVTQLQLDKKHDLLYCRFLLSHLQNIPEVLCNWMHSLKPGGIICIDELEDILTDVSVFKRYLQINHALIQSQGAKLYIGKYLHEHISGFHIQLNRTDILPVEDSMAAGWFYPNTISIWESEEFIKKTVNRSERKALSDSLLQIHNTQSRSSNITWKMKRFVLTKQKGPLS
jgi:trans-aconitate 2-methyltransferase